MQIVLSVLPHLENNRAWRQMLNVSAPVFSVEVIRLQAKRRMYVIFYTRWSKIHGSVHEKGSLIENMCVHVGRLKEYKEYLLKMSAFLSINIGVWPKKTRVYQPVLQFYQLLILKQHKFTSWSKIVDCWLGQTPSQSISVWDLSPETLHLVALSELYHDISHQDYYSHRNMNVCIIFNGQASNICWYFNRRESPGYHYSQGVYLLGPMNVYTTFCGSLLKVQFVWDSDFWVSFPTQVLMLWMMPWLSKPEEYLTYFIRSFRDFSTLELTSPS